MRIRIVRLWRFAALAGLLAVLVGISPDVARAQAQDPGTAATAVVKAFYDWYLALPGDHVWEGSLQSAKPYFDPDLYGKIIRVMAISDANTKAQKEPFVDYDLFSGLQETAYSYQLGKPAVHGNSIAVPVSMQSCSGPVSTCKNHPDPPTHKLDAIVRNENGTYVIYDLVYGSYGNGNSLRAYFKSDFKI